MLQAILSDKKRIETSVLAENKHSEVFCLVSATSESSESVFIVFHKFIPPFIPQIFYHIWGINWGIFKIQYYTISFKISNGNGSPTFSTERSLSVKFDFLRVSAGL